MADEQDYYTQPEPMQPSALVVRNRFSMVWLIPILALVITGWLGLQSLSTHGPTIAIQFENAQGLEPGRTKVKHRNVDVGVVEKLEVAKDLSHVMVTVSMSSVAAPYLNSGARFWVVRPQLSEGVSSLEPLISGSYIEFEPGKGENEKQFVGEETPHLMTPSGPGETYTLHTATLGAINQGTPIYFHGVKVGEVLGYELSDKDGSADVHIFIHAPHNKLVHTGTKFWNSSGISVQAGSGGVKVQLESFQTLLTGGISFDIPHEAKAGEMADATTAFTLYSDAGLADDAVYTKRIHFLLNFSEPVPGLGQGSQVRLQGLSVGQVTDVQVHYDASTHHFTVPVKIEIETERAGLIVDEGDPSAYEAHAYASFREFVAHGLRARLGTGNLLTGEKIINLDLVPDAPAVKLTASSTPEIPTLEAQDIDSAMRSANEVLSGLKVTVAALNKVVTSPEIMQSVRSLNQSLGNVDHITHETSVHIDPLLQTLQSMENSANATFEQANKALGNSSEGGDLAGTLREFKNSARSARILTDYLDNHPEALLRGKPIGDTP